jgi:hypothetical protein
MMAARAGVVTVSKANTAAAKILVVGGPHLARLFLIQNYCNDVGEIRSATLDPQTRGCLRI